ncbi:MAG TPA: acyl carrier protein [Stellaceae bacterium]|nr:acyl carrier protein [Stellaceae bacterium]
MTEPQIYEALTTIFRDVFLRDDMVLSAGLSAKEVPDWDSFKQIEIIIAVESEFGIKFQTREMDALANVGDLVRLIADKT